MEKLTHNKIVVKVGTSTVTYPSGKLNYKRLDRLSLVLCDLLNAGAQVILVSSGAVGAGLSRMGLETHGDVLEIKQAAAAVGQCELIHIYDKFFSEYGKKVAQLLLTRDDIESDTRRKNIINTFNTLLSYKIIPIVNENDTVSVAELEMENGEKLFSDNDNLSAIVAELIGADLLILLSDIDGLYDCDPRKNENAKLISEINEYDDSLMDMAGGAGSARGRGGMKTKLMAAKRCYDNGIDMVIANGDDPALLYDICYGKPVGTKFLFKKG